MHSRAGGRVPGMNAARLQQLITTFDKNGDGKLDAEERGALIEYLRGLLK